MEYGDNITVLEDEDAVKEEDKAMDRVIEELGLKTIGIRGYKTAFPAVLDLAEQEEAQWAVQEAAVKLRVRCASTRHLQTCAFDIPAIGIP